MFLSLHQRTPQDVVNEKDYGKIAEILGTEPGILLRVWNNYKYQKKVSYTAVWKHHILCMSVLSKLVYIAGQVVPDNDELTQVPTEGKRNRQDQS